MSSEARAERHDLHPRERVEDFLERGWWTDETIDAVFRETARERGDALAIVDPANRVDLLGSEPRRLTWTEVDSEVTHLAARLLELGVGPGDLVGVQLPNTIELAELYLAAWTIGAGVSPMAMQYREHELETMAGTADFDVFVTCQRFGDRSPAAAAVEMLDRLPSVRRVLTLGAAEEAGGSGLGADLVQHLVPGPATADDVRAVEDHRAAHPVDPNGLVTVCWTSGTESKPTGVKRAHYDWLSFAWSTIDAPRLVADDVMLNPFPMINMAGINGMFLPWLRVGCVLVQHHPFDGPTFFGQIAREGVTYTVAPPALLWGLLHDEATLARIDLSTITRMGSGSAPLQPAMVRGWQERHGIGIINFFGSNEGMGLMSSVEDFPDPDRRAQYFPRYGTPGVTWSSRVSEWYRLKLVDLATGETIEEPGRPGELHIWGPQLFAGYVHGDQLGDPLDAEGFLRTGDIFEIAGERGEYLHHVDRAKDLVIRGGMNIAPAELEALITEHPAVLEASVVGQPDEVLGERVAAVVVVRPGSTLTLDELVAHLRSLKIASYKLPERLEVVDALPRNPVGKVLKRELRERLRAESRSTTDDKETADV
ncbi:class I adenylate-forming enzyme family protein [Nocardioides flavescens]|uniref:AMP-binding protein n=1 Tax=Nocardioides flavescens TaxID=2691959 RepID=A0A6L7F477_9ACTN|nr:class I adenylate-forming enzyme family protein [Nocardioides flavescens]MXG92048.1 AMP-binding protein [Nocardioides flavescens]